MLGLGLVFFSDLFGFVCAVTTYVKVEPLEAVDMILRKVLLGVGRMSSVSLKFCLG